MRALTRALVASAVAALAVPVWTAPAAAETVSTSETAAYGAYFSSTGIRKPDESPAGVPNAINDRGGDGVEPGKLAVAAAGGQDDKISFLFFQLADVPFDATIDKATLTVPLQEGGNNVTAGAEPVKVTACPAGPEGFFGEDGAAMTDAPSRLCDQVAVTGKASPDGKAYVFDIGQIAAMWTTANDGVALVPSEGAKTTPFQVVFQEAEKATLDYTYTALPEAPIGGSGGSVSFPDTTTSGGSTDLGGGFDSGASFDTGTGTADLGAVDTSTPPLVSGTAPEATTPEPQTADSTVTTQRAAADLPVEVLSPTPSFWLAALLLGGGLLFLGLVMGDNRSAALATSAKPSRLSRTLTDRQRAASLLAGSRSTS